MSVLNQMSKSAQKEYEAINSKESANKWLDRFFSEEFVGVVTVEICNSNIVGDEYTDYETDVIEVISPIFSSEDEASVWTKKEIKKRKYEGRLNSETRWSPRCQEIMNLDKINEFVYELPF